MATLLGSIRRMGLGATIQSLRRARRWSQAELGRVAGVDQPVIQRIEAGATKNPSMLTVAKIARALGVTTDALIGGHEVTELIDRIDSLEARIAALERKRK